MPKVKKTPVFFIATKIKEQPVKVSFYTHSGRKISKNIVKKEKSRHGTYFFACL